MFDIIFEIYYPIVMVIIFAIGALFLWYVIDTSKEWKDLKWERLQIVGAGLIAFICLYIPIVEFIKVL